MNDQIKLEPEEEELLDSYEQDEWRSVDKFQEKSRQYQTYAGASLESLGLVSVALPQEDINAIREKAATAGVSYQTLIANVVHRYVTGSLVEKQPSA
jgi:predicted DNA binding CopG/RHH family protein